MTWIIRARAIRCPCILGATGLLPRLDLPFDVARYGEVPRICLATRPLSLGRAPGRDAQLGSSKYNRAHHDPSLSSPR